MLKILIMFSMVVNMAFAKNRYTEAEKKEFLEGVKQEVIDLKKEKKIEKVTPDFLRAHLEQFSDDMNQGGILSKAEREDLKKKFDQYLKDSTDTSNLESNYTKFLEEQLNVLDKKPLEKIKEGQVCNGWACEDGLKCVVSPREKEDLKCKAGSLECKVDGDCCSGSCQFNPDQKKKFCDVVSRCFRPQELGKSCLENPVCAVGACLAYDAGTIGIGECHTKGKSCKKNSECCSNSCQQNKCVESFVCKDCAKKGTKPSSGKKCCEGLYLDENGRCVPDMPPSVVPQVNIKLPTKIFSVFAEFILSQSMASEEKLPSPEIKLTRHSNFETCDMRFRDDVFAYLQKNNADGTNRTDQSVSRDGKASLLDLESAMLAFDYMLLSEGEGVNDYWTQSTDPTTSIFGRLHSIAVEHNKDRIDLNEKLDKMNVRLTCMCIDAQGYEKIKDPAKKTFFEKNCEEFKETKDKMVCTHEVECSKVETIQGKNKITGKDMVLAASCGNNGKTKVSCDPEKDGADCQCLSSASNLPGDKDGVAGGVKGKRMLVEWTRSLRDFNMSLTHVNDQTQKKFAEVRDWVALNDWNKTEMKDMGGLFTWKIKELSKLFTFIAIIAVGLIGATIFYLAGRSGSGSLGMGAVLATLLLASQRGAWKENQNPQIRDDQISSNRCSKIYTCKTYERHLIQPYNRICNAHISSDACIKNMAIYDDGVEATYLVDPWVPLNIKREQMFYDSRGKTYAEKLNDSFLLDTLPVMKRMSPGTQKMSYLNNQNFFSSGIQELYFNRVTRVGKENYTLKNTTILDIKEKAKQYAIDQRFFEKDDKENLEAFAEYAFKYHLIMPKSAGPEEISYSAASKRLQTYLEMMANDVSAYMMAGSINSTNLFGTLNNKYLDDYLKTLEIYKDQAANANDGVQLKLISDEMAKAQSELNNQKTFSALMGAGYESQLSKLNPNVINSAARGAGVHGGAGLSSGQTNFLNAVARLREVRKEQLKKLANYKKAVAGSANADRLAMVESASKNFHGAFSGSLSASKSGGRNSFGSSFGGANGGSSAGAGSGAGTDALGAKGADGKNKADSAKKSGLDLAIPSMLNANVGVGVGLGGIDGKNGTASDKNSSTDDQKTEGVAGRDDEDSKRIADAIDARDRANKEKYKSKEDQTIFEKITNAYIRNYDKIFSKVKIKVPVPTDQ